MTFYRFLIDLLSMFAWFLVAMVIIAGAVLLFRQLPTEDREFLARLLARDKPKTNNSASDQ